MGHRLKYKTCNSQFFRKNVEDNLVTFGYTKIFLDNTKYMVHKKNY